MSRRARLVRPRIFLVILVAVWGLAPAAAQDNARRLIQTENADYSGFDYQTLQDVDLDRCRAACTQDTRCRALTYNEAARYCFLKDDFGAAQPFRGAIAARFAQSAAGFEGLPSLDLSFLPDDLSRRAAAHRRGIETITVGEGTGHDAVLRSAAAAVASGEPRAAVERYRAALRLAPDDTDTWLALARAYLAVPPKDYSEQYGLPEAATAAATSALEAAATQPEHAVALAVLGRALERQQIWRPAIESYRTSLELIEDQAVRADFERVRAEHGFRVLDYSVDSETASPRACVQFSEPLGQSPGEIVDFVTLDGARPEAVAQEERQLCVEGLEHGRRYRLGLRQGLPSTVGEVIEAPVALTLYVRDRDPSVRFTGRNYVLPRTGAKGVPLVTVNTEAVKVTIYRIAAGALAGTVRDGRFLDQLSGYGIRSLVEDRGKEIWQGDMPVERRLNAEVTTAFPVSEVIGKPDPGVYVMTAAAKEEGTEDWDTRATQWFIVTDIGVSTLNGADGLHVFVRSLGSAEPISDARVDLVARANEVLATTTTDAAGHALFAPGFMRGEAGMAPALARVEAGEDHAFVDLTAASFDLGDRGVAGRPAPGAIDVFMYTERGVYRPGANVHLVALARDQAARAVDQVPLTFVIERPDGVEDRRIAAHRGELGGHVLDLALADNAMTGTWRARAYGDPNREALAEVRFLVEDFVPERLDLAIEADAEMAAAGGTLPLDVEGEYLYGAPAAGLTLEGEAVLTPTDRLAGSLAGYRFGLDDDEATAVRAELSDLPPLGENGRARIDAALPVAPQTTRPLIADVAIRLREPGGRAVERHLRLPVLGVGPLIGIKSLFDGDELADGAMAEFEVVAIGAEHAPSDHGPLTWELVRLERRYDWYRLDGRWRYEPTTFSRRVADGRIAAGGPDPARISVSVPWGRYRLEVANSEPDGPATSIVFNAGWFSANAVSETPDILDVALDKPSYRPGETAVLRLSPQFAGTALVAVMGERLLDYKEVEVGAEGGSVSFQVDANWGGGAYVAAMLYRPMDVEARRNPARAIGLDWLALDAAERTIDVDIEAPEVARPRQRLEVPLRLSGLAPGEEARVVVAAVDVGILNLTGYEPPDPQGWFFGQRQLGMEIRDLYGNLIDGLAGARGQARSGGGESGLTMSGAPPTETPLVLFSGIVSVEDGGRAEASFDLPDFNGRAKLMAVAWSGTKVGAASRDVTVRDPVVMIASLPRFIAPGDTSRLRLDIDNVSGPAGEWTLSAVTDGPAMVEIDEAAARFTLVEGERRAIELPLSAAAAGQSQITVNLIHAGGPTLTKDLALTVRPGQAPLTRRSVQPLLARGGPLTLTSDLVAEYVPGTAAVTLAVSRGLLVDTPGILDSLDRFPYGCAEQITSRALPLLYVNDVAESIGMARDAALDERIEQAIARVLARQGSNGSFGLWAAGGDDLFLDAYVTDFLTRAREAGREVPPERVDQALDRLENALAYSPEVDGGGEGVAYALYVLARAGRASLADLRYHAEVTLDRFGSSLARAQLGAALSLYGDRPRAARVFRAAVASLPKVEPDEAFRQDYGSALRDGAAMLALIAESRVDNVPLPPLARNIEDLRQSRPYTSTQEEAWLLLAAHALRGEDAAITLQVGGRPHVGRLVRRLAEADLAASELSIRNTGSSDLQAVVTVRGVPRYRLAAASNGVALSRSYRTLDGDPVDPAEVTQNTRLVVALRIERRERGQGRLIVTDLLPGGFEIDNPHLVASGDAGRLAWLGELSQPAHAEFRDDRFAAAFEPGGEDDQVLRLAYVVRAVAPGTYALPAATVEDMYRPEVHARTISGEVRVVAAGGR